MTVGAEFKSKEKKNRLKKINLTHYLFYADGQSYIEQWLSSLPDLNYHI
jgi:hypothetical protein